MTAYPVNIVIGEPCFSVRYGYKPDNIGDATLDLVTSADKTCSLHNNSDGMLFKGQATSCKDVECVLVWNHQKEVYELRTLDSCLRVNKERTPASLVPPQPDQVRFSTPRVATPVVQPSKSPTVVLDDDEFGDLANDLENELETSPRLGSAIGTAGLSRQDDDEISSEEE